MVYRECLQHVEATLGMQPLDLPSISDPDAEITSPFGRAIEDFIFSIDSIFEGFPLTVGMLSATLKRTRKEFEAFIEPYVTKREEDKNGNEVLTYFVPPQNATKYQKIKSKLRKREHALRITRRNSIVTVVGQFDSYIGNMARAVLYEKSDIIDASERPISFSELVGFRTIDEARDSIVEKEIDGLLRGSHLSQIEWFEKKLKVKLSEHCSCMDTFIELTERRNLFVHTDGKVSRQYVQNCSKLSSPKMGEVKLGETPSRYKCLYKAS
jgi:hypothetical protein